MLSYFIYGTVLGLSAGVSPGPLLMLVIVHTLQHDVKEGAKVAVAPLITDLPLIAVGLVLFSQIPDLDMVLGIVSFIGGAFVLFLGMKSLCAGPVKPEWASTAPRSFLKGALVNALNPHPYLFWFTVGVPTIMKACQVSVVPAVGFSLCFFVSIVGAKILIAVLVNRSRAFLSGPAYRWTVRCLGLLMIAFSLVLFHDGLRLLRESG